MIAYTKKQWIIIILFLILAIAGTFVLYKGKKVIRLAIKHRLPYLLWTPRIKNNVDVFAMISSIIPKNPVIIEAGAYDGAESVLLATFWKNGTIHSFEPIDELYARVIENTKAYKNIHTYQMALADHNGIAEFHVSSFKDSQDVPSESSSLLAPKKHLEEAPNIVFNKKIQVLATTIDHWAEKNHVDHVDFIWLDTQGCELLILKNAPKILKTVKAVLAEVSFVEAYKGQPLFDDLKQWMDSQNFSLAGFHFGCNWIGDALFVRRS